MDSPLNRAHKQERKAEKLISGERYLEAMACYKVAADYITEAMKATTASQALVSLQLQYEDHLRKQRLLQFKIETISHEKMNSENCMETNVNRTNEKQPSLDIMPDKSNDSSFHLSLQSSQELLQVVHDDSCEQQKTVCQSSHEDLQMQVLSLTQALEDSNRENNHLRNIVIRFKEILNEKFGLTQDEIEAMLVNNKQGQSVQSIEETKCNDSVVNIQNLDEKIE